MALDSSTLVRHVSMTAMLVGPSGDVADRVSRRFDEAHIAVVRASHAAAACERLAVAMPQVVIVLGTLRSDEREALADRATAVGALLMYVDPELDSETLEELVTRAAQAVVDRKRTRDEAEPEGPPPVEDDVDSQW